MGPIIFLDHYGNPIHDGDEVHAVTKTDFYVFTHVRAHAKYTIREGRHPSTYEQYYWFVDKLDANDFADNKGDLLDF